MINTIFYFVSSFDEYTREWSNGNISPRTIVFVADKKAIYKNGVRYGGFSEEELAPIINNYIIDNDEINDRLFDIENSIKTAQDLIDALNAQLDGFLNAKQGEIKDIVNTVFAEYAWLKKNLGDVFASSAFQSELNGFLTAVGVIKDSDAAWTTLLQTMNSITGRVVQLENGVINEATIKQWISDGVSGIDLSSFVQEDELNTTQAFIQLRSSVEGATSAIGAWSSTYNNNTITDKISALTTQVNNLDNSVTTTLSSTIRQYLGNDLETGVANYLQQQAGLILESNLDGAVANLFANSQSSTAGALNNKLAGLILESNLDSAVATLFAANSTSGAKAAVQAVVQGESSNLTLTADQITLAGNTLTQALTAGVVTAGSLNVVNNNKKVAYIDNTGHASFIDGHVYIPYQATNWLTNQEVSTVGLYVDSVAKESNDTTYATTNWSSLFHPRTLIEPDGLRFENSNKALTGIVKTEAVYSNTTPSTIETYSTKIASYDPENNLNFCGILMQPTLVRQGHESTGGYCRIYNYKSGDTSSDTSTWTGRLDIDYWHSMVVDVADEIVLTTHNSAANSGGISLTGNIRFHPSNGVFTSTMNVDTSSDERIKTVLKTIQPAIEDIADVRVVDFTYNNDESNTVHAGSIAQDWQNIVPNAVREGEDGMLTLDYSAVSVVSAVTAAKEIVALKEENRQLKERLARIEAALNLN